MADSWGDDGWAARLICQDKNTPTTINTKNSELTAYTVRDSGSSGEDSGWNNHSARLPVMNNKIIIEYKIKK